MTCGTLTTLLSYKGSYSTVLHHIYTYPPLADQAGLRVLAPDYGINMRGMFGLGALVQFWLVAGHRGLLGARRAGPAPTKLRFCTCTML